MITLRPYQQTAIDEISHAYRVLGHRRVLFVLPTGAGKTVVFSHIVSRIAAAGKRVWVIAHRDELLTQISKSLHVFNIEHGVLRGGSKTSWHSVQVCSVQTLVRRLNTMAAPDFIIIDEAHHAAAGSWKKILTRYPDAYILGVTATPIRLDGRGLGHYFDHMVLGPTPQWLTDNGYLSPVDIYAPELINTSGIRTRMGDFDKKQLAEAADKPAIYGNAVEHYRSLAYGKRIIVFCVNLRHVQHTLDAYRDAGIPAASLDGNMTAQERAQVNADFEAKRIWVLVTCDIVSEGYDVPGCDGIQMLRPTQSEGLYLQQCGRGLRIAEGKRRAIILDHVQNWHRHGHPLDERYWELTEDKQKRSRNDGHAPGLRMCSECFAVMAVWDKVCFKCGAAPKVADRTPENKEGTLILVTPGEPPPPVTPEERRELMEQAEASDSLVVWHQVAKRLGYKSGWAYMQFSEQRKKKMDAVMTRIADEHYARQHHARQHHAHAITTADVERI